jgi:hypothetical protein
MTVVSNAIASSGEVIKAAPPIAVTGLTIYGVDLGEIVLIATLIYTLIQIWLLLPRFWQSLKSVWRKFYGPLDHP